MARTTCDDGEPIDLVAPISAAPMSGNVHPASSLALVMVILVLAFNRVLHEVRDEQPPLQQRRKRADMYPTDSRTIGLRKFQFCW